MLVNMIQPFSVATIFSPSTTSAQNHNAKQHNHGNACHGEDKEKFWHHLVCRQKKEYFGELGNLYWNHVLNHWLIKIRYGYFNGVSSIWYQMPDMTNTILEI